MSTKKQMTVLHEGPVHLVTESFLPDDSLAAVDQAIEAAATDTKADCTRDFVGADEVLSDLERAEADMAKIAETYKDAKKRVKELTAEFKSAYKDARSGQKRFRFSAGNSEPKPLDVDDTAWQLQPFKGLDGISDKLADKLAASGIENLGQLAALQEKHGEFWYREIKGVGPEAAGKIGDACYAFHQRYNVSHQKPAEAKPGKEPDPMTPIQNVPCIYPAISDVLICANLATVGAVDEYIAAGNPWNNLRMTDAEGIAVADAVDAFYGRTAEE